MRLAVTLAGVTALTSACGRSHSEAALASDAGVATVSSATASASPAASCTGPAFAFGDQDRLGWQAVGKLRYDAGMFSVDLGNEIEFRSNKYGSTKGSRVALTCTSCGSEDAKAFDVALGSLVGKRVRATGIVSPAWTDAGATTPPVVLATRIKDVAAIP